MRANIVIYMEEADRDLGETVPGVNDVDTSGSAARVLHPPCFRRAVMRCPSFEQWTL